MASAPEPSLVAAVPARDARLRELPPDAAGGRRRPGRAIHGPAVGRRAGPAPFIVGPSNAAPACPASFRRASAGTGRTAAGVIGVGVGAKAGGVHQAIVGPVMAPQPALGRRHLARQVTRADRSVMPRRRAASPSSAPTTPRPAAVRPAPGLAGRATGPGCAK